MRRRVLHKVLAVVLLHTLWPTLVLAQEPKVGVVTTLHGVATVARAAIPQEIPLKFKDDVFLRDRITTRERSIVRVLLGGKALVTVRELSVLTIMEEPGRSTVDLQAGKIALAVARRRMRPGEVVEVRTPNAVAGIRGTVVIVEILRATAQAGPAAGGVVTNFVVLSGFLDVAVAGQQITVGPLQSLSISGNVAGQVQQVTPAQVEQIKQDYASPAQHQSSEEGQKAAAEVHVATAATLAAAITGEPPAPPPTPAARPASQSTEAPVIATTGTTVPTAPPDVPDVRISGANMLVTGPLRSFSGTTVRTGSSAVVRIANSTVTQLGAGDLVQVEAGASATVAGKLLDIDPSIVTTGGDFVSVGVGGSLSAAAPLLTDVGGALSAGGDFLGVSGTLTSTTTQALLQFTGSTVAVGGTGLDTHFVRVSGPGASMNLQGPLLEATGSALTQRGFAFLEVFGGGSLTSTTASSLIDLSGGSTTLETGVRGVALGGATVALGGPLFQASGTALTVAGDAPFLELSGSTLLSLGSPLVDLTGSSLDLRSQPLVRATLGSTLLNGGGPAIRVAGGSLTADALVITDGTGNAMIFTGTAFHLSDAAATLRTLGEDPDVSDDDFFFTLAENEPALRISGSTLTVTEPDDDLMSFESDTLPTGKGVALIATNSTLNLSGTLLEVKDPASTDLNPLVQLTGTTVNQTGTTRGLLRVRPHGGTASMTGPMLRSSGSTIVASGPVFHFRGPGGLTSATAQPFASFNPSTVTSARQFALADQKFALTLQGSLADAVDTAFETTSAQFSFFAVNDGSSVTTSGTAAPLLKFAGTAPGLSKVTAARSFVPLSISAAGEPAPSMTLSGPLLEAVKTDFKTGDPAVNTHPFLLVGDGATLTGPNPQPLLSFDDASLDTAGNVLSLRRSRPGAPSRLTLSGPLLTASNGSTLNTSSLGFEATFGIPSACCSGFYIGQGAQLSSTSDTPLIQLADSTFNAGPDAQSGGRFFVLSDTFTGAPVGELVAPASASLAGPLLSATDSAITALFDLVGVFRSSLASTSPDPLIQLDGNPGSTVTLGGMNPIMGTTSEGRLLQMSASGTTPATLTLQGPLLRSVNSTITTTDDTLGIWDGAALSSTTPDALVSVTGGSLAAQGTGHFVVLASALGLPPSMTLVGPLLSASNTTLTNGDPTSNVTGFVSLLDGGQLTMTGGSPLLSFENTSLDTAGNILVVRPSSVAAAPSITLSGPLLSAANSTFNTTSLGLGSIAGPGPCCGGFFVGQGGQLTATAPAPLIQLTGSSFNAGPDAQSGGSFFSVSDTASGGIGGATPASVSLAGPLLRATDSTVSALFDLVGVRRSSFTSSSASALIQLDGNPGSTVTLGGARTDPFDPGGTAFGRLLLVRSSDSSGTAAPAASVSLTEAGALLAATNSTLTMTGDVISVQNGAALTSETASPLIQLNNSSLTAGTAAINADVLEVFGTGGAGGKTLASVSLKGPLLSVASSLDVTGGLAGIFAGGEVTTNGSTDPFVKITGGTHSIASNPGAAMFRLFGRFEAVKSEEIDVGEETPVTLTLGTDRPLQHGGVLLETTGATVTTQQGVRLDTALLEATMPLIKLLAGSASTLTSASHFVDLSQKAKLTANLPSDALIRLNGSALTVQNGSLFNVAGGSNLSVTGNVVSLTNGSTLSIPNGALVALSGGSVFRLTGSFGSFGSGSNTINLPTSLEGFTVNQSKIPGFGVALGPSASPDQVSIAGAFTPFAGTGTVTVTPNGIVLKIDDGASRVRLCTTGCP